MIEARITKLEARSAARDRWLDEHPEVKRDLQAVEDTITHTRLTARIEARLESLERRAASARDVGIDVGIEKSSGPTCHRAAWTTRETPHLGTERSPGFLAGCARVGASSRSLRIAIAPRRATPRGPVCVQAA